MNLPIPSHLRAVLVPVGENNSTFEVTGDIRCTCGCSTFRVNTRSSRQIVTLFCTECGREHLLFHAGRHGWDGFVDGMDLVDRDEPFQPYLCPTCGKPHFHLTVGIESLGKEYFWAQAVSQYEKMALEDWVDAFETICVSTTCADCNSKSELWVDWEAM